MNTNYFTNEIVGLLTEFDPDKLKELRAKFPSFQPLLEQGIVMGEGEPEINKEEIQFRLELCKEGLKSILNLSEEFIPKLRKKLLRLKNTQFISQILIAISGASIIAMLGKENKMFNLVAASLAILGSLLTILIQHQSTGIGDKSKNLSNAFTKLVEMKMTAERHLLELKIHEKFSDTSDKKELKLLISESNSLCEDVREIMSYVG